MWRRRALRSGPEGEEVPWASEEKAQLLKDRRGLNVFSLKKCSNSFK